jgi:hypothetical protein
MLILDTQGRIYTTSKAQDVARQLLEADTEGWDYTVETIGDYARIAVYDADGNFLGHF